MAWFFIFEHFKLLLISDSFKCRYKRRMDCNLIRKVRMLCIDQARKLHLP